IGEAGEYRATVLPGESPGCTSTVTGGRNGTLVVTEGVTCLDGARVNGGVTVQAGASLVATDSSISGELTATGAVTVQLFGTTVQGSTLISGTTADVTTAGNTFRGEVTLSDNTQVSDNERFSRLAGEYGPILAGNSINGALTCAGNNSDVDDFGAQNTVSGTKTGQCAGL
ncbi:MAG: M64 family metallopeptidase, partial [Stackebrandtia sp.]